MNFPYMSSKTLLLDVFAGDKMLVANIYWDLTFIMITFTGACVKRLGMHMFYALVIMADDL